MRDRLIMNYEQDILEALYDKEIIDEELYLKCKPKYISSLPGDLRSTDVDLLKERYDATMKEIRFRADTIAGLEAEKDIIQQSINRAVEENDELQKNLDDYEAKSDKLGQDSLKSQQEALEEVEDLKGYFFEDFINGSPNEFNVTGLTNFTEERLNQIMDSFGSEFNRKGYLTSQEADVLRQVADDIDIIAGSFDSGFSDAQDEWGEGGRMLADDIRTFADKYDINNNPIGDTFQEVMSLASQAPDWRDTIEANDKSIQRQTDVVNGYDNEINMLDKEIQTLLDDSQKTQNKINKLTR